MRGQHKLGGVVAAVVLAALATTTGAVDAKQPPTTQVVKYDWKNGAEYDAKWAAPFGPGEGDRSVGTNQVTVDAAPFTTGADLSVFDHLKYIRISAESFAVPESGSLEMSVQIDAETPGTEAGHVVDGCYGPSFSWDGAAPCVAPWSQVAFEGQQAGVVLNMINFQTGELFDWFVSSGRVFALIERLPSAVTGSPDVVGLDKAYTQIIKEAPLARGGLHTVAIRYTRGGGESFVEYFLDNKLFARVDDVGVPLDVQGVPYTGRAPSLGSGEVLSLDSFVIGHGLFSLLDAFPYQHPERPALSVSIPLSERLFGQGAIGTWKNFKVTTRTN
ncbi:MAG: DUF6081 family protein [Ilumatobacteraceae bacterium]